MAWFKTVVPFGILNCQPVQLNSERLMSLLKAMCSVWVLVSIFWTAGCSSLLAPAGETVLPATAQQSLVRVTVTSQNYVFHRPWQQRRPVTQTAIGVLTPGGQVLVNGLLVADHRYIELETIDTQQKQQARVAVVDYEANLALLEPIDTGFLSGRKPLPLADEAALGERLTVWQVKPNGDIVASEGQVTSVELGAFTQDNFFLTYRLNSTLQYRFNNMTLPVVKGRALSGLVLRHSQSGQPIEVIATSVIRHFLMDAMNGTYRGFPTAGFHYGLMLDPQLRRYIGLPQSYSGIYVQKVIKGSPADRAGLQAGDVVVRMGDYAVSNSGQFDHPLYGRTSLVHLLRTFYHVGDMVALQVFRGGRTLDLGVTLDHRGPDDYLVPPYSVDKIPEYLIVGGMVLQELTMSYLREYGGDWAVSAPIHLLYYQQHQDYLNGDGREKIVILSDVIPTPYTVGYERLSNLVILSVNGRKIRNLDDVRTALAAPVDGFLKIEVQQHPKVLYLDPKEIPLIHQMITQRYGIPIPPLDPR
ncbi:MAG: PDZ domain-containing protein [Desulfobacteraceae bacterium]|nr:MAG: PDZ domain-containing protein [Desulfobacteraceae bacterium]